jgi:hypothetical protein
VGVALRMGGLRAVLGHSEGCGLRLPQAKASPTLARRVIHSGPEAPIGGAPVLLCGAVGWVAEIRGHIMGYAHPLEKSAPGSEV